MSYYFIGNDWYTTVPQPSLNLPENVSKETGILDAKGNMISRPANPIGFGRDKEWTN